MRVVEVDEAGEVKRRLDIDPARRPLIQLMFALALRGKGTAAIARAVNDAGWQTKPLARGQQPKAWDLQSVLDILQNPRYAGLSASKGQVLGRGQWPAYVSERQYYKLKARFAAPRPTTTPRRREPYLLSRLAKCGYCGTGVHCHTGEQRKDGSFIRTYCCWSHDRGTGSGRCPAPRLDADIVEAMFASRIHSLLIKGEELEPTIQAGECLPFQGTWSDSPERQRVLDALLAGDDIATDEALEALLARMAPEVIVLRRMAASSRLARRLELARQIQSWAAQEHTGRTDASRARTGELNRLLRGCFSSVSLAMDKRAITIAAHRHNDGAPATVEERFDRRDSERYAPESRHGHLHRTWEDTEILAALQAWAEEHGRSPKITEWYGSDPDRPTSHTARRRFGSWRNALKRAGLKPAARATRYRPRQTQPDTKPAARRCQNIGPQIGPQLPPRIPQPEAEKPPVAGDCVDRGDRI